MLLIYLDFFPASLKPGVEAVTADFLDPTDKLQPDLMRKDITVPALISPAGK